MNIWTWLPAVALCASEAVAGPTWLPGSSNWGTGYVEAVAFDGTGSDVNDVYFLDGFGSYSALASTLGGSTSNHFNWDAKGAHSDFVLSANSGTGGSIEYYFGLTLLTFTALSGGDFDADIAFDWRGSGQDFVEVFFYIADDTGFSHDQTDTAVSGPVSISYVGTLIAGREYELFFYAYVSGRGDVAGSGSGSGDIRLESVPAPSAVALAGLGLLGLGARRRRATL